MLTTPKHFAYIKIAEGCDHPCTFCVIPQYRGKFRSRRFESVISEATRLFAQGVREINLIGQDTTVYGEDLGLKDGLSMLLSRLANIPTEHEKWVRFLYAYPNKVTQKLLDTLAEQAGDPALAFERGLKRKIAEPLGDVNAQHDQSPCSRRKARRANHSEAISALIAMTMETTTSRNAAGSPSGVWISE